MKTNPNSINRHASDETDVSARRDAMKKIARLGVYASPALLAAMTPGKAQAASAVNCDIQIC